MLIHLPEFFFLSRLNRWRGFFFMSKYFPLSDNIYLFIFCWLVRAVVCHTLTNTHVRKVRKPWLPTLPFFEAAEVVFLISELRSPFIETCRLTSMLLWGYFGRRTWQSSTRPDRASARPSRDQRPSSAPCSSRSPLLPKVEGSTTSPDVLRGAQPLPVAR